MTQLRPHVPKHGYLDLIRRLQRDLGYNLAAVVDAGEVQSVAGYRYSESLAWGKFMYVDDLVTRSEARSKSFGHLMLEWLVAEAKRNQCGQLHLDSGTQRQEAHKFYFRESLKITSFHFSTPV
jgi:GNAT superfamily N-acetyltransferase